MYKLIEEFLREREENNLLRVLHPASLRKEGKIFLQDREYIDFSSNDYLGLSNHPCLISAAKKAADSLGVSASASRLLSGDSELHHQLEDKTAAFKGKESALVFNCGYQANIGIISALCKKGDVVFSDKLNHASIIDGIQLSGAKLCRFFHNDADHLKSLLEKERAKYKNALIVTETIFSMEGDRAPLGEIVELKEKFGCLLLVDEAHSTGIFGERGSGVVEEERLIDKVDLIMGTFGKALGSFGAYTAGTKKMIEYLINTARGFIYSTALPPYICAVNLAGLEIIEKEPFRRKILLENAEYFRDELSKKSLNIKGSSQIIPLILGESKLAENIALKLQEKGYWVLPIRPPTVPKRESRLRFSLTFYHSMDMIKKLIDDISEIS